MADLTQQTVVADPDVLAAWRSGPRWFHVVVAMIDDDEVESRRHQVVDLLGPELVSLTAPGQAHVTIWAAGFEPPTSLTDSGRIPLQITAPATFTSAAYLHVTGSGVERVRSRLLADGIPEDRQTPFVPHVTVGTYLNQVPLAQVHEQLRLMAEAPPIPVTGHIRHLVVDTRSPVGALTDPQ